MDAMTTIRTAIEHNGRIYADSPYDFVKDMDTKPTPCKTCWLIGACDCEK